MASNKDDLPKITLSTLKFANWQGLSGVDSVAGSSEQKPKEFAGNVYASQSPADFRRPEAYERMAADIPGEELGHDATIWKLYLEEAEEYDQELVKTQHASLDMLLLFAALFSAILTAFLIESKNLLQEDPADTSAALLLMMVQSQQRIELGLPPPESTDTISPPSFVPSASARWINGIWFTSLALSLSAALVAMLGKEWLNAYLASRPRPAHNHALLRQSRLEGLEHWWALHILALLPSLLHASLLLFSIGLVIYLWTLDATIAVVIAGFVGITSMFYIVTAVLGALYQFCPYVTQISGYIQTLGVAYIGRRDTGQEPHQTSTSLNDLRALLWLANHARDPAIIDCSYQALAGLRLSEDSGHFQDTSLTPDSKAAAPSSRTSDDIPMQLDQQTDLRALFFTVCERFENLTKYPLELSAAGGANAARYAHALVGMSTYLQGYYSRSGVTSNVDHVKKDESNGAWSQRWWRMHNAGDYASVSTGKDDEDIPLAPLYSREYEKTSSVLKNSTNLMPSSFATRSLDLLEKLWSDNSPAFSGNTYAILLISEFSLLDLASNGCSSSATHKALPAHPLDVQTTSQNAHVIDITSPRSMFSGSPHAPNLGKRYSRTLVRASALLKAHSRSKNLIGTLQLNRLLQAVYTSVKRHAVNPRDSYSGIHFLSHVGASRGIQFIIPVSAGAPYDVHTNDLNSGLLGSLIAVLNMSSTGWVAGVETLTAAARALSILAPICLQTSEGLDLHQLLSEFDFDTWSDVPAMDLDGIKYIIARQILLILRYLGLRLAVHKNLCVECLKLVLDYLKEADDIDAGVSLALRHRGGDVIPLIEFIGDTESNLSEFAEEPGFYVADLSRMLITPNVCLYETVPPHCLPTIMRLLGQSDFEADVLSGELQTMVKLMRDKNLHDRVKDIPWSHGTYLEYLQCFTQTDKGFAALAFIGGQEDFTEVAVDITAQITRLAAGRDPGLLLDPVELRASAIPGFLDILSIAVRHLSEADPRSPSSIQFSQDVLHLVTIASKDEESRRLMVAHPAYKAVLSALRSATSELESHTEGFVEELGSKDWETDDGESDDQETDDGKAGAAGDAAGEESLAETSVEHESGGGML